MQHQEEDFDPTEDAEDIVSSLWQANSKETLALYEFELNKNNFAIAQSVAELLSLKGITTTLKVYHCVDGSKLLLRNPEELNISYKQLLKKLSNDKDVKSLKSEDYFISIQAPLEATKPHIMVMSPRIDSDTKYQEYTSKKEYFWGLQFLSESEALALDYYNLMTHNQELSHVYDTDLVSLRKQNTITDNNIQIQEIKVRLASEYLVFLDNSFIEGNIANFHLAPLLDIIKDHAHSLVCAALEPLYSVDYRQSLNPETSQIEKRLIITTPDEGEELKSVYADVEKKLTKVYGKVIQTKNEGSNDIQFIIPGDPKQLFMKLHKNDYPFINKLKRDQNNMLVGFDN